jgi:hypothetical protein
MPDRKDTTMKFGQYKMNDQGHIQRRKVRKPSNVIADGCRLIQSLSDEDNYRRLKRHVEQLVKRVRRDRSNTKFNQKNKTRRSVERAGQLAPQ